MKNTAPNLYDRMMWRVRRHVYPRLGRFRPDLSFDPRRFDGFRDPELRQVAGRVKGTRFYHQFEGVNSWITLLERQYMYAFGRWHPGPFLEIGPWVGMSTCHLARGIKDSGAAKRFVTIDLNPSVANFRPTSTGIGFFYPCDSTEDMGSCSLREYEEEVLPVISSPDGVLGTLRRNLKRHRLDHLVDVREGQFETITERDFRFVFIDAMHSPNEIRRNATKLQPFLRPGSILWCHDLRCHPDNEAELRSAFRFGHTITFDQSLIGEIV
jgi:hypothetical protein